MKRLRSVFAACLLAAMVILPAAAPVSAASIGACGDGNAGYHSTGTSALVKANVIGIYAHMTVPGSTDFGPCTPDDNSGANVASVNMSINYMQAFVQIGILRCNTPATDFPASLCDGSRHFYGEQHGAFFWDHNVWDFGYADTTAHDMQISYSGGRYYWYIDSQVKGSFDMGTGLVPAQNNIYSWQGETKDRGDGLGQTNKSYVFDMQTASGGVWTKKTSQAGCYQVDPQHTCGQYGSYGFWVGTNN